MQKLARITLLIILLSACSAGPVVPSQISSDKTITPAVLTITPTVTLLPTVTPNMTPTPTVHPISAPTAIYDNVDVEAKCVEASLNAPTDNLGKGAVVIEGRFEPGFFLSSMETGSSINLIGKNNTFLDASVSGVTPIKRGVAET